MTRTVADASRDYRKRRADKVARYESALRAIIDSSNCALALWEARNALNPVTAGGDE